MSGAERETTPPTMAEPAFYRIRVRGHVDPTTARRLRGLAVENTTDEAGAPVATLLGQLPDQAALMGVLHALHDDQLPLLSAAYRASTPEDDPASGAWRSVEWTTKDGEEPGASHREDQES